MELTVLKEKHRGQMEDLELAGQAHFLLGVYLVYDPFRMPCLQLHQDLFQMSAGSTFFSAEKNQCRGRIFGDYMMQIMLIQCGKHGMRQN